MYTILTNKSISNGRQHGLRTYTTVGSQIHGISNSSDISASGGQTIDLRGLTVLPGLIDIHTHGCMGCDVMSATPSALNKMSEHKLNEGVTGFFPSTVTASLYDTCRAVDNIQSAIAGGLSGANILGVLLEGPYINPQFKGAQMEQHILPIDQDQIAALVLETQQKMGGCRVSITIAPELPDAVAAIQLLTNMGVNCCIGHSSATYEQVCVAIKAGARIATHTYNAMSPLNHRNPGMVGAVLTLENIAAEIICDLVHVHPAAVRLAVNAKGADNIILVTDSAAPAGLPDGEYNMGERVIIKKDGVARTPGGSLASSSVGLVDCVRNMYETVGIPLTDAVTMATSSPARAVGVYDTVGSLESNKNADIIAIDDDFNIRFAMVGGVVRISL